MSVSDIVESSHPQETKRLEPALHLAVLGSFAVQPLFTLLSQQPEFFAVRGSSPVDLLVLTGILFLLFPALLAGLALSVSALPRPVFVTLHAVMVATLASVVMLAMVKKAIPDPAALPVGIAAAVGTITAGVYWRWEPVRRFLTYLSPAILILPCVFLLRPGVVKVLRQGDAEISADAREKNRSSVVMVVFDGLPVTSLMDTDGSIDESRYPNFAALAREATWFRRATTVSDNTIYAIPAILSGKYPEKGQHPTLGDHPQNLFTLLGFAYHHEVVEPVTHLCPAALCGVAGVGFSERMLSLLADLQIVYLHIVLPSAWAERLPSITQGWSDFGEVRGKGTTKGEGKGLEPAEELLNFVNQIEARDEPTVFFIHSLLPHPPTRYYGSGTRYTTSRKEPSGEGTQWGEWSEDDWAVLQSYQRHLLQVEFVDYLLGRLIVALKSEGLYESALLVVTADHGTSFRPGDTHRALSESNLLDIVPVPLFIKTPYQKEGRIDDSDAETVDILPTLAGHLGVKVPWPVDGRSLDGGLSPERPDRVFFSRERMSIDSERLDGIEAAVERKMALFGGSEEMDLFQIGPRPEIIGMRVMDLPKVAGRGTRIGLHRKDAFKNVDAKSGLVPGEITGFAVRDHQGNEPLHLAIAVNGTIRATSKPYEASRGDDMEIWAALVGESAFQEGENDVEIFELEETRGGVALSEPHREDLVSFLNTRLGVRRIVGVRESGFHTRRQRKGEWLRWTNGDARLLVPLEDSRTPLALRLELHEATPAGVDIELKVNDSIVLSGKVPGGYWQRTVILNGVASTEPARIQLISNTFSRSGLRGERRYGVPVKGLWLLDEKWTVGAPK